MSASIFTKHIMPREAFARQSLGAFHHKIKEVSSMCKYRDGQSELID